MMCPFVIGDSWTEYSGWVHTASTNMPASQNTLNKKKLDTFYEVYLRVLGRRSFQRWKVWADGCIFDQWEQWLLRNSSQMSKLLSKMNSIFIFFWYILLLRLNSSVPSTTKMVQISPSGAIGMAPVGYPLNFVALEAAAAAPAHWASILGIINRKGIMFATTSETVTAFENFISDSKWLSYRDWIE